MNESILVVAGGNMNGITIEICQGEIPDKYRFPMFDPILEFELPDTKASDEDFNDWLGLYRHSTTLLEQFLLFAEACFPKEKTQCG